MLSMLQLVLQKYCAAQTIAESRDDGYQEKGVSENLISEITDSRNSATGVQACDMHSSVQREYFVPEGKV